MERDHKRHSRFVEDHFPGRGKRAYEHFRKVLTGKAAGDGGQSTVEYAVVMAAGVCILVALGFLSNAIQGGMFVEHAITAASHNVEVLFGGMADVFSY